MLTLHSIRKTLAEILFLAGKKSFGWKNVWLKKFWLKSPKSEQVYSIANNSVSNNVNINLNFKIAQRDHLSVRASISNKRFNSRPRIPVLNKFKVT